MITLRTLGPIELTGEDGREYDGLLRQPKRLALLCYLASPAPGAWHRRDVVLAAFWPEVEAGKARTALRNALYVIRQELGAEVLRVRGDDGVAVDPARLSSDLGDLQAAIDRGDFAAAMALYQGEFLPGLFVHDAAGFERWLDAERQRLKQLVEKAATHQATECEQRGDLAAAIAARQWLFGIDPDDESAARKLIQLLDRVGDRGQALATFERLRVRLQQEFDSEPAEETLLLVREIRNRRAAPEPRVAAEPAVEAAEILPALSPPPPPIARRPRRLWRWAAAIALVALTTAAALRLTRSGSDVVTTPATLLVLPMENATGSSDNDYVATGLAEDIAQRLSALHAITVRSEARAVWPATLRDSIAHIGPRLGAQVVLKTRLSRLGDSLRVEATVVSSTSGATREVTTGRFTVATLRDAGSSLAAAIAGAVFRVPLPEDPRQSTRRVDPEAYRLTLMGWHQLLLRDDPAGARDLFLRATKTDPLHARAWSGLSSTWSAATTNGLIPFDEGAARAEGAATRALALDSLQGTAWANLGVMHALTQRSLAAGEPYFRRAIAVEPANAEIYMVYASALRFASQWERARDQIRIARQLDPLTAYYAGLEANGAMCEGRPLEALASYRVELALDPHERGGYQGVARALARLGRWDQATEQLRRLALSRGDSALATALATSRGEAGYWALKHREGELLLKERVARARDGWLSPYLIGVAEIGAGEIDHGLDILEAEVRAGNRMVFKLSCNPEIDEVRSMPRFQQLLKAAGSLPLQ